MSFQGKYLLIYMTFKDDKHSDYEVFIESLGIRGSSLYKSFYYIFDSLKFDEDKEYYINIINRKSSVKDLEITLYKLSEYLSIYYNEKVILLIDEYDTPIHH